MMFSLSLHRLAAGRGDGLHPALLAVLQQREALAAAGATVEDIAARRGDVCIQAGPHPNTASDKELPVDVVRLAPRHHRPTGAARKAIS